jgi:hypothetical protein
MFTSKEAAAVVRTSELGWLDEMRMHYASRCHDACGGRMRAIYATDLQDTEHSRAVCGW